MKLGMNSRTLIIAGCMGLVAAGAAEVAGRLEDVSYVPYEHKAIQYFQTPTDNPVNHLDDRIDKGEVKLDFQPGGLGYLPSVLKQFGINVDSQVLVFTQSSFQAPLISKQRPRAIYFNDEVSVGFVQHGEVMEVSAFDPTQGVAFYSLNTGKTAKPSFARREVCLQCHQGGQTLGVPGLVVSSQYVPKGAPAEHVRGGFVTDDRTPLEDRWGGWYVSGRLDGQESRGIATGRGFDAMFDTAPYLSPDSDVVALLTLEHQTRMTNLITRIGWDTRIAIADGKLEESRTRIEAGIEDMVGYMLFVDEAEMKGKIEGVSTFSKTFPERGPRDKQGRSLRDFDLEKRLFKYPLSYMVYTKAFDNMPDWARTRVYQRLFDVLTGKDTSEKFARLSADDRRNVLAILRDTKPNLPGYWKALSASAK
jgi:hypothetical protein